jgi:hypothetical protein
MITRRLFLLSSAAVPVACSLNRGATDSAATAAAVRRPQLGQSWRYAKHDVFTRAVVQTQVDEVAAVDGSIEISSRTEGDAGADNTQTASKSWWRKYFHHPQEARTLPGEIQQPWGEVRVDPHWRQVQVYDRPIPLWPVQLQPGWKYHVNTKYKTSDEEGLSWAQTMRAEAWETITVPAGQFKALKYSNLINFTSSDSGRTGSVRRETIWLVPEIGRWAARESTGTYFHDESVDDQQLNEGGYRWELLSFT